MTALHHSIYPELAAVLEEGFPKPPVSIFDHHMHIGSPAATRAYVEAARSYGVTRALGMAGLAQSHAIRKAYGDFFLFCAWLGLEDINANPAWQHERLAELDRLASAGFVSLKVKIVPDREGRKPLAWFDDRRIAPVISRAQGLGMSVQAHVGQPEAWFRKYYADGAAGRREDYLAQVERMLDAQPGLVYVGVHMGGCPEDLDYLDRMMDKYPDFHVDTSATKWVIRELSMQRESTREFFIRRADRILFGSDLVVQEGVDASYYTSRFHVQRLMWETPRRVRSMIKDPDSETEPLIEGLDLPAETLEKIYAGNARRLFGLA